MIQFKSDWSDEEVTLDIQRGCREGSIFFDWLTAIRLSPIDGENQYKRDMQEGMRALASEIQDRAMMSNKPLEVKSQTSENDLAN